MKVDGKDTLQVVQVFSPPSTVQRGKECSMTELWQMSGLALGKAIARREISAIEVLDAIVARVEAVNPKVNAVVTLVAERAQEEARAVDARAAAGETGGPLCGV